MASSPSDPYINTDVIIRLLTGDDEQKRKAATALFEKVAQDKIVLSAPDTVIAGAVFVLSSKNLYHLPRAEIRDILGSLLKYPSFKVENKQSVIKALDFYADLNMDFGDALVAVLAQQSPQKAVYSYDHDFNKVKEIKRIEPKVVI